MIFTCKVLFSSFRQLVVGWICMVSLLSLVAQPRNFLHSYKITAKQRIHDFIVMIFTRIFTFFFLVSAAVSCGVDMYGACYFTLVAQPRNFIL